MKYKPTDAAPTNRAFLTPAQIDEKRTELVKQTPATPPKTETKSETAKPK